MPQLTVGFLTHEGFIMPLGMLKQQFGNQYVDLIAKLTLIYYPKVGPPVVTRLYKISVYAGIQCIQLPRTLIYKFLLGGMLTDLKILLAPVRYINVGMAIELFNNQVILVDYLCDKIFTKARQAKGGATGILNLLAGMGKSFVAAGSIARLGMRTLYIVPKRPLAIQAVKDLRGCFYPDDGSTPTALVGHFSKPIKEKPSPVLKEKSKPVLKSKPVPMPKEKRAPKPCDESAIVANQAVTVIVINSAILQPASFFAGYSFIVFDEVHMYCSAVRKDIFKKATSHVMLGMTATSEDRTDGFDPIAHKELAVDGIIRAENIKGFTYEGVNFDCHARIINYSGPTEYTQNLTHESTGLLFTHYMHNQFISDGYRTQMAVNELLSLYDWRGPLGQVHCIYVFAEEIGILKQAKTAFINALQLRNRIDLIDDINIPECGLEMFTGGLKDEKITDIVNNGRVLFTTYGFAGSGLSILKMTAELLLTPRRANMKQIFTRIRRRGSDLTIPRIVVDIVDVRTALKYQVSARKLAFEFYGFTQTQTKITYGMIAGMRPEDIPTINARANTADGVRANTADGMADIEDPLSAVGFDE